MPMMISLPKKPAGAKANASKASPSASAGQAVVKKAGASAAAHLAKKKPNLAVAKEKKGEVPVTLRVPEDVLQQIDQAVASRKIKIPRHTWLLEAVAEKLDRQG